MTRAVTLASLTTFGVGGPVRDYREARTPDEVRAALEIADARGLAVIVLGGGSNVLAADRGLDAMILRVRAEGLVSVRDGTATCIEVG
ncbi:MAG: FAD-binding protein, partial [Myxococcales bacterium]|nr:FAD-binding protein [Myxococcales bacterium]